MEGSLLSSSLAGPILACGCSRGRGQEDGAASTLGFLTGAVTSRPSSLELNDCLRLRVLFQRFLMALSVLQDTRCQPVFCAVQCHQAGKARDSRACESELIEVSNSSCLPA